jgi:hypothetical protein
MSRRMKNRQRPLPRRRTWFIEALDDRNMLNAAPVLVNAEIKATGTGTVTLTSSQLLAQDADTAADALYYTITAVPQHGTLKALNVAVNVGFAFSQNDVNLGRVKYTPDGTSQTDSISFELTDNNAVTANRRVNINNVGLPSSGFNTSVSADGRYVVYASYAGDIVSGDTNGAADIFLWDGNGNGLSTRISVGPGGVEANSHSFSPSISADGKFVVYTSFATNLVTGDTNNAMDVFVYNVATGVTTRESVNTAEVQANSSSMNPSLSADGRYVIFASDATNLVTGDTNAKLDVFVRDRATGNTYRESVAAAGAQLNDESAYPSISSNGRYVAFASKATNAVAGDTNGVQDVFVRDRSLGTIKRVSVATGGAQSNSLSDSPKISGDGSYIAYRSFATNLVAGDTNSQWDVFVTDRGAVKTERVSVDSAEQQATAEPSQISISDNGRLVTFQAADSTFVAGDNNSAIDVFRRDLTAGTTTRVSVDYYGSQTNADSFAASVSGDGRFVVYESSATDLYLKTASAGGITRFDSAYLRGKVKITVPPPNHAPVLTTPSTIFAAIVQEDAAAPSGPNAGTKIPNILRPSGSNINVTDSDAGAKFGIAITSTSQAAYYSMDSGATWKVMPATSPQASFLLPNDTNVRIAFKPGANVEGLAGVRAFTFRAWDRTTGVAEGTADTRTNGGTTAFSATVDVGYISVVPVNDRPVLDSQADYVLTPVEAYNDPPRGAVGTLISQIDALFTGVKDVDVGAKRGIAIGALANTDRFNVWYSLNGGAAWTKMTGISSKSMLLLAANASTMVYVESFVQTYTTVTDGPILAFRFIAWDQSNGAANGSRLDQAVTPTDTSLSFDLGVAEIEVKPINYRPPALDTSKSPQFNSVSANAGAPVGAVGTLMSQIIDQVNVPGGLDNVSDPNGHAKVRIVITGINTAHGAWYFSKNNGSTWSALTNVTPVNAPLFNLDTRLYFRPFASFRGTISDAITFRATDNTGLANGTNLDSTLAVNQKALSVASETASITVV